MPAASSDGSDDAIAAQVADCLTPLHPCQRCEPGRSVNSGPSVFSGAPAAGSGSGPRGYIHATTGGEPMATSMFAGDTGRGTSGRAIAEMNITPLVDVMLVLLIIFM